MMPWEAIGVGVMLVSPMVAWVMSISNKVAALQVLMPQMDKKLDLLLEHALGQGKPQIHT